MITENNHAATTEEEISNVVVRDEYSTQGKKIIAEDEEDFPEIRADVQYTWRA